MPFGQHVPAPTACTGSGSGPREQDITLLQKLPLLREFNSKERWGGGWGAGKHSDFQGLGDPTIPPNLDLCMTNVLVHMLKVTYKNTARIHLFCFILCVFSNY